MSGSIEIPLRDTDEVITFNHIISVQKDPSIFSKLHTELRCLPTFLVYQYKLLCSISTCIMDVPTDFVRFVKNRFIYDLIKCVYFYFIISVDTEMCCPKCKDKRSRRQRYYFLSEQKNPIFHLFHFIRKTPKIYYFVIKNKSDKT